MAQFSWPSCGSEEFWSQQATRRQLHEKHGHLVLTAGRRTGRPRASAKGSQSNFLQPRPRTHLPTWHRGSTDFQKALLSEMQQAVQHCFSGQVTASARRRASSPCMAGSA